MAGPDRSKSLQQVLRDRRAAKPLLTVEELRRREATRQTKEAEEEATRVDEEIAAATAEALVARRTLGRRIDPNAKLPVGVYGAILAAEPEAYFASNHWFRRARAQTAAAPACEVARCGEPENIRAFLLDGAAVGAEQPGRDTITLCPSCGRRVFRLERERGRRATRDAIVALDPDQPLYDADAIAALKRRYGRTLRREDLRR